MSFLESLSPDLLAVVRRKSRGAKRPSYVDGVALRAKRDAERQHLELPDDFTTLVQISLDLEAALILLPPSTKKELLAFLGELQLAATNTDKAELELMQEVVAVRAKGYDNINLDVAAPLLRFDQTRSAVVSFLAEAAQTAGEEATTTLLPDLKAFFAMLSEDYQQLSRIDVLSLHDHITDTMTVRSYADSGFERVQQLQSWVTVISTY